MGQFQHATESVEKALEWTVMQNRMVVEGDMGAVVMDTELLVDYTGTNMEWVV